MLLPKENSLDKQHKATHRSVISAIFCFAAEI